MGQIIRREMVGVDGFGLEKLEVVDFRGEIVEVVSHGDVSYDKWVFEYKGGVVNVPMKYDYEEAKKIMEEKM